MIPPTKPKPLKRCQKCSDKPDWSDLPTYQIVSTNVLWDGEEAVERVSRTTDGANGNS